jgi:hypothetical protein
VNEVESFLKQTTEAFEPPMVPTHRLVLRLGREFEGQALPSRYKRGRPRECFLNSLKAVFDFENLRYVEGFALAPRLIPVEHAWCIDERNRVIDLTWDRPEGCEYFGIIIPTKLLLEQSLKNKVAGVLDDWRNQWEFHSVLERALKKKGGRK